MSEEEERDIYDRYPASDMGSAIIAESLAPELGSDQRDKDAGRTDMRRMTVIQKSDQGFLLYAKMRARKSRIWRMIYDEVLNLNVGVGGRGRRDIIRMEGVSKGGGVTVEGEIPKPGWIGRNVLDRDWERKQREEQQTRGE